MEAMPDPADTGRLRFGIVGLFVFAAIGIAMAAGLMAAEKLMARVLPLRHLTGASFADAAASGAPPPRAPGRAPLGLNLAQPFSYLNERALMNLAQGAEWQASRFDVPGWKTFDPARIDVMGNVTSLLPGEFANAVLVPPESAFGKNPARIRCTWTGLGKLAPRGGASGVSQSANSFEFNWAPPQAPPRPMRVWIELSQTDQANPLRAIDCREKTAPATATFSSEFLESLKGFKVIRFMDWQNSNANAPVTWETRVQQQSQSQVSKRGVALEYMMTLVRETGTDPWFAMPWNADDDYIRRFATYVRDTLPAGHTVYVELANEVWNPGFAVSRQAQQEGLAEGLSTNPHEAKLRRYAEKSAHMLGIWTEVFKATPSRLVRVVATQHVSPWSAETVLGFRDTPKYVDALATAPYFGHSTFSGERAAITDIDAIFAYLDAEIDTTISQAQQNKAIASRFGKRYIAYEAGQHIINANNVPLIVAINRDPRMYGLYKKYISTWNAKVGDTLALFGSTSPISSFGAWGLREYAGQPLAETPKRRAAIDYMASAY